jgi:hypothetical protein
MSGFLRTASITASGPSFFVHIFFFLCISLSLLFALTHHIIITCNCMWCVMLCCAVCFVVTAQPQALVLAVGDRVSVTRSKTLPKQWVNGVVKKAEGLQVLVQYDQNAEVLSIAYLCFFFSFFLFFLPFSLFPLPPPPPKRSLPLCVALFVGWKW